MAKQISFILSPLIILLLISSIVMAGTIQLPKTGQTTSYLTGDDGDLKRGVAWPILRFTDNGNGTVTDNLTGLMWSKDGNLPNSTQTWQSALNYIVSLNSGTGLAGYYDWRLPNRKELFSLIDYSNSVPALPTGHPFSNVQSAYYWSSSTYGYDNRNAWLIGMSFGNLNSDFAPYDNMADKQLSKMAVSGVDPQPMQEDNPIFPFYDYLLRDRSVDDGSMIVTDVAKYKPNPWGLYDVYGNVAEWTITAYDESTYNFMHDMNPNFEYNALSDDPPTMKRKVIRGGSWKDIAYYTQVGTRTFEYQDTAKSYVGFRCVRSSIGDDN